MNFKSKLKSYFQLVRLPNVFTAGADSLAGWLLLGGIPSESAEWLFLVIGSMAIYAGGIALNDVFDAELDRIERPQRPIPSGAVPKRIAGILSVALLLLGLVSISLTGKITTIAVGTALILAVVLYDAWLRKTILGPEIMGLCRALNFGLGMSAMAKGESQWLVWLPLISYGLFVTGITWISRHEAADGPRWPLELGARLQIVAMIGFALAIGEAPNSWKEVDPSKVAGLIVWSGLCFWVNLRSITARRSPSPQTIQLAVKTGIMSLVWIHFSLLWGTRGLLQALLVILLWIPAKWTGRWLYST